MEKYVSVSLTQKMYGWSKWGGGRHGMVKEDSEVWYCQNCAEKQLRILPSYLFPVDDSDREFVRICTLCKARTIIKKLRILIELKTSE